MIFRRTFNSLMAISSLGFSMNIQAKGKILVVYFSKSGNTENVAKTISKLTGADVIRVETLQPYPQEYKPATEVVKEEIEKGIVRPIKATDVNLNNYDTIILGTPTWWHHVAVPLQSWIKKNDLRNKNIATYNTDGGGGTMHTKEDFEKLLSGSNLLSPHFTIFGSHQDQTQEVRKWLKKINLLN